MPENVPLLDVQDLCVTFETSNGPVYAVRDLSFTMTSNETLAIVGESGSGKSTTALTLLGLQPEQAAVAGSARLGGLELLNQTDKMLRTVRGLRVTYVPQNPFGSLNPVFTIGTQIVEAIRAHGDLGKAAAEQLALDMIATVGIDNPRARFDAYPHQLSGGMRQRVVIAMALANRPDLIIADEPTSSLDVTVQAQVLDALEEARALSSASLLLITHDLGVVARHADRVLVMYAGSCVESGPVDRVFAEPAMPYTKGLLGAIPRMDVAGDEPLVRMPAAPGRFPDHGCAFTDRCPAAADACRQDRPSLQPVGPGAHDAACLRLDEIGATDALTLFASTARRGDEADDRRPEHLSAGPVLSVRNLVKHFGARGRAHGQVHAVCDISLEVNPGETLAIVGESGSGKTTLNRTLVRMEEPTSGTIAVAGHDISHLSQRALRPLRKTLQMVLQDSTASLNPKISVGSLIGEPLTIHGEYTADRVRELLTLVGLDSAIADRFPAELSGGQRQRVAIARGLAVQPEVLILDEPVSALDVSVQAEILALLRDLQLRLGVAYIFVTHDLGVVRHIADRVAVMYLGQVIEVGSVEDVLEHPSHPYTRALVSAVPVPDPAIEQTRQRIRLEGEIPSAHNPPTGCRFRTRCPLRQKLPADAQALCESSRPELILRGGASTVACHHVQKRPEG